MTITIDILALITGLVIGSFLNVCIYRIPLKESIVFGRSHCPSCGGIIRPFDLIPVFSFLILKGKCRSCGDKISVRYPIVEALNGFFYLIISIQFGATPIAFVYAAFVSSLLVVSFTDIDHQIIPNGIVIFILLLGLTSLFVGKSPTLAEKGFGFFAVSVPLLAAALISKGGVGGGDIKLAAAAGLVLGWKLALLSLFFACVTAAVFGILYTKSKGVSLKTPIPFAPFLSFSFLAALFIGNPILTLYLSLLR